MTRIGEWISGGLDPVRLARQLKFDPDKWQRDLLRSTDRYVHLVSSRQVGKSTTTAVLALHTALYKPGSVVLIFSPSERQSAELFVKISAFYRQLDKPISPEGENVHGLRLENGSRILSLPASESNVRGFTADLILEDEAGFVSDSLFNAVAPMLAVSGGRMILMGTPAGRRGHFYETSQSDGWRHFVVPATDCPRITPDFLESERERLGDVAFEQEYLCSFRDSAGMAFRSEDIDRMFDASRALPSVVAPQRAPRTDPALAALQRRIQRAQSGPDARRKRWQALCEHMWHTSSTGLYCARCGVMQEEVTRETDNRSRLGPGQRPHRAGGHRFS